MYGGSEEEKSFEGGCYKDSSDDYKLRQTMSDRRTARSSQSSLKQTINPFQAIMDKCSQTIPSRSKSVASFIDSEREVCAVLTNAIETCQTAQAGAVSKDRELNSALELNEFERLVIKEAFLD